MTSFLKYFPFILASLALLFCSLYQISAHNILFIDDQAFSFSLGLAVSGGELPLAGLPSHLGGRHLGPLWPWLMGIVSALTSGEAYAFLMAELWLKYLALIGVTWFTFGVMFLSPFERITAATALVFALTCSAFVWLIRVNWINNFLPILSLFFLACLIQLFKCGVGKLPLLLLSATLLLQFHLACVPLVVGALLGTSIFLVQEWQRISRPNGLSFARYIFSSFRNSRFSFFCLLVLAALWTAPLSYELFFGGNMPTLVLRHFSKAESPGAGLAEVSVTLIETFKNFTLGVGARGFYGALLAALGLPLLIVGIRRLEFRVKLGLLAFLFGSLLTVLAAARFRPPVNGYYLYSLLPLAWLALGIAAANAARLACAALPGLRTSQADPKFGPIQAGSIIMGLIFIGAFIGIGQNSLKSNFPAYTGKPFAEFTTLAHAEEVSRILKPILDSIPNPKVLVLGESSGRANAYYSMLSENSFPRLMFSKVFRELPSVASFNLIRSQPPAGVMIACSTKRDIDLKRLSKRRELKRWEVGTEVSLANCASCTRCRAWQIQAVLNSNIPANYEG